MIFDEFARVLETSPDFLRELVNVVRQGPLARHPPGARHPVAAGQALTGAQEQHRPADLAAPERGRPTASRCSAHRTPPGIPGHLRGRGMILCTKDEVRLPRVFQSGYLGDAPPRGGAAPARVRVVDWPSLGADRPEPDAASRDGDTDQTLVIAAIEQAARELAVPAPSRPLLPPLPAVVRPVRRGPARHGRAGAHRRPVRPRRRPRRPGPAARRPRPGGQRPAADRRRPAVGSDDGRACPDPRPRRPLPPRPGAPLRPRAPPRRTRRRRPASALRRGPLPCRARPDPPVRHLARG